METSYFHYKNQWVDGVAGSDCFLWKAYATRKFTVDKV